ncbi:hypothetical protein SAMN02745157_4449 [Kaistia soli DSM 19436]|uniref:Uncharacterized protein n=1 Tax=Kaistia soli DSM 19436 TaxID=1122133 RepID=A0A1M5KZR3_9HYPH|nr:hypothetical protein [Kaistia soli]SHG58257.1 hypothetical protein SAMN02745157_4449 [Kaistia soli DSM 19436]
MTIAETENSHDRRGAGSRQRFSPFFAGHPAATVLQAPIAELIRFTAHHAFELVAEIDAALAEARGGALLDQF